MSGDQRPPIRIGEIVQGAVATAIAEVIRNSPASRLSPSTTRMFIWLLMQMSPAELHRLGLIESPDVDLNSLDEGHQEAMVYALLRRYDDFTEAHDRLTRKQKTEAKMPGITLTQKEMAQVMSLRIAGIPPDVAEQNIINQRLSNAARIQQKKATP